MENAMKIGYTFSLTQDKGLLRKGEKVCVTEIHPMPCGTWVEIASKDRPTYTTWLFAETGKEQEAFGQKTKAGR